MRCRVCDQDTRLLKQLFNMPDCNQYLPDRPDSVGITLNVVQCWSCGLVQLDNEPVWYWNEHIDATKFSKELQEIQSIVSEECGYYSFCELEHQPDPNKFLQSVKSNDKKYCFTVPNSVNMLDFDVCIDHLLYFEKATLRNTLEFNGYIVNNIYKDFHGVLLSANCRRYEHMAVYGAGHQSFAWLALHPNFKVDYIIDDSQAKQGKYSPATNIPIVPYQTDGLDCIVVMAGGYSDEVIKRLDFDGAVAVLRKDKIEVVRE